MGWENRACFAGSGYRGFCFFLAFRAAIGILTSRMSTLILPEFLEDNGGLMQYKGHRICLHDVIRYYNNGFSAEMIHEALPTLSLLLIYKSLAFYLENSAEIDAYVARLDAETDELAKQHRQGPTLAELRRRMEAKRRA
jgi:uncharacterized protein (DUF433 family)